MTVSTRMFFAILAGLARPAMNVALGKEWHGLEKLPRGEGFIVVPNHCTEIDPIVVGHMLYNQNIMPHFLAKDGLFRTPVLGAILRGANQIPVERSGIGAGKSLEGAEKVLAMGGAVVIYPEGTLTRDPDLWPMKGRTGAARLALSTGAKVVPVAHWGAQEVFPRYAKGFKIFPRKKAHVVVGDPIDLSAFNGHQGDKATLEAMTEVIMADITTLLEPLRGGKAPARRWDPTAHDQSTHGRFVERGAKPAQDQHPQKNQKNDGGTTETGDVQ
ncbi:1-acyl-sn-glycerol-3-phosphate acyltransferase [Arthrobacter livingstonensis]|uniref:1-acyl-sn-glycerol-3-phosphate acyltransferase n=1 Tax=Arthrobacter livingstonensis TaxID=670078 RepID=A0A2V5LG11_9MICC|nr:lysophospholipid acyltransferase family protein [Arthrobacter livingstonensis]PYI68833.1 1-acyl-sn-glycerol-3-phosphate acyltransferase [Arthrobacter livingstonensis]